jgi:uncharacterized integral membrane protein
MRITTILIIVTTVLLTIILMQNTEPVRFSVLFGEFYISKLAALATFGGVAFVLGILVGRPKKARSIATDDDEDDYTGNKTNTLSDEDRDYISQP